MWLSRQGWSLVRIGEYLDRNQGTVWPALKQKYWAFRAVRVGHPSGCLVVHELRFDDLARSWHTDFTQRGSEA